ncbi:transcription termination/antitermination protein NusG [Gemmata sp.]|uniref:transcription termination/antitermination protein NusG n=1 Tax=Gemmata sp. TaxID=1914242 RepID=UPI003F6F1DF0
MVLGRKKPSPPQLSTVFRNPGNTWGGMSEQTPFPVGVEAWAALRTSARWEKQLAETLASARIPVFLPLMTRFTTSHGKRRAAIVPVFSGYVFCSEPDFLTSKLLSPGTRSRVAQVLRPPDREALRIELRGIADLLKDRHLVQERLVGGVGEAVRITGGSFAGHEGRVLRAKPNRWVLVIEVSFLGARLEAEIDERMVQRVI